MCAGEWAEVASVKGPQWTTDFRQRDSELVQTTREGSFVALVQIVTSVIKN